MNQVAPIVTGGAGFLGWHLRVRLRAVHGIDTVSIGREHFEDSTALAATVANADTIYHLAGVNRAASDSEVEDGNIELAERLATAVKAAGKPTRLIFANSIQADLDNPYGRGKSQAADRLKHAAESVGGSCANVLLPNLFGEHGRPNYNSFVSTFCHDVANGGTPRVTGDRSVPLLHAQAASGLLAEQSTGDVSEETRPEGERHGVSETLEIIKGFHDCYEDGRDPGTAIKIPR